MEVLNVFYLQMHFSKLICRKLTLPFVKGDIFMFRIRIFAWFISFFAPIQPLGGFVGPGDLDQ